MKILSISILSLACSLIGVQHAAATTVTEDLDSNGYYNIDVGEFTISPSTDIYAGFTFKYKDGGSSAPSTSLWLAHRPSHEWIFQHASPISTDPDRLVMKLDASHQLLLYSNVNTSVPSITLNPGGVSSFTGSVILNGASNTMLSPASVTNESILNIGMGNARYMKLGFGNSGPASSFVAGENSTAGAYAVAIGSGAKATGYESVAIGGFLSGTVTNSPSASASYSVAIGAGAEATAEVAIALGDSTASGIYSFAAGISTASGYAASAVGGSTASGRSSISSGGATASGEASSAFGYSTALNDVSIAAGNSAASLPYSTALGNGTASQYGASAFGFATAEAQGSTASGFGRASGSFATAFGYDSKALGENSTALGFYTRAPGYAQVAIGLFNDSGSSATSLAATEDLFIIGNGTSDTARSNALVVKKNGNAVFSNSLAAGLGSISTGSTQTVVGTYNNTATADATSTPATDHTQGVFTVGAGTSSSAKLNALRVLADGTVLIQERGDLSMGTFRNGPKP